jgi:subtilisin family serine protease
MEMILLVKKKAITLLICNALITSGALSEVYIDSQLSTLGTASQDIVQNDNAERHVYIVQLKGKAGIEKSVDLSIVTPSNSAKAIGKNSYNPTEASMQNYINAVKSKQAKIVSSVGDIEMLNSYIHSFNGFSALLTPGQVKKLKAHPQVINIFADRLEKPQSVNTADALGLTSVNGQHSFGIKGDDIIIGVIDTGIWPEHPSFADDGSYSPATSLGWRGVCDAGEEAESNSFKCNNKLIGARFFADGFGLNNISTALGEFVSPRDADGHGTHTSSTAAGNEDVQASITGRQIGAISGVAPRARIAMYKTCWNSRKVGRLFETSSGCFTSDNMAAIDAAVADGVDVINYSISGPATINDPVYIAALNASQAGIFFAAAAGNSGPTFGSVSNIAPWQTTVGAATFDTVRTSVDVERSITVLVDGVENETFNSVSGIITSKVGSNEALVGAPVLASPVLVCDDLNNAEALKGNIAVIGRRGCPFLDKLVRLKNAGAIAVIIVTDDRPVLAINANEIVDGLPTRMVEREPGLRLVEHINGESDVTLVLESIPTFTETVISGDAIRDFSGRGANRQSLDILKPDIAAPGNSVLAATSPDQLQIPNNVDGENFAFISGTSMASPHVAGIAALIMQEHPEWSPAQIKSAIMTTSRQNLENHTGQDAGPHEFGAGHVVPLSANNPGLTYDANIGDYLAFLCGQAERDTVTIYNLSCEDLVEAGFPTSARQLNYPSIAIGPLDTNTETIFRTVTDVTGLGGEYDIKVDFPGIIETEVTTFDSNQIETESDKLVVPPNGTASYSITFSKSIDGISAPEFLQGSVTLESDSHEVFSPISILATPFDFVDEPDVVSLEMKRNRASFKVRANHTFTMQTSLAGLEPGQFLQRTSKVIDTPFLDFEAEQRLGNALLLKTDPNVEVLKFSLSQSDIETESKESEAIDLDLLVFDCQSFMCQPVGISATPNSSDESVIISEPSIRNEEGDHYIVIARVASASGNNEVDYGLTLWNVGRQSDTRTRLSVSKKAIEGRFTNVRISDRSLETNKEYLGAISFFNKGELIGKTVIEVAAQQ